MTGKTVLRWLAVLPAAILGFGLSRIVAAGVLRWDDPDGFSLLTLLPEGVVLVVAEAAGAYVYVLVGCAIAPSHVRAVAVILAILFCSVAGAFTIIALFAIAGDAYYVPKPVIPASLASIAAALVATWQQYEEADSRR